ncbi:MAG: DUF4214 domain-containing protein, partial [Oxalobacteraceae bacterium]
GSAAYFKKTGSTNEGFVAGLFQDFVERTPDEEEETKPSVAYLDGGGTREEMAAAVSDSDDFRVVWTQRFYQQFLGRAATDAEYINVRGVRLAKNAVIVAAKPDACDGERAGSASIAANSRSIV